MLPSLYICEINHKRSKPKQYSFKHTVFFFCFDITKPQQLERAVANEALLPFIGVEKLGIYSYYENDHLPEPASLSLPERVKALLIEHGYTEEANSCQCIILLTQLRVLGYGFNPVSFYFCLDANEKPLCAIAEVCNTFGEMKPYVIPQDENNPGIFKLEAPKLFYVSPFSELTDHLLFKLALPGESLSLSVDDLGSQKEVLLHSDMKGQRQSLTAASLLRATLANPWVTLQVIAWIHWHAFRLWLKGVPHFSKEANPHNQVGLFHPHTKTFQGASL